MALAVNTVAAGGLPVVDVTATSPNMGMPVTEAAAGKGLAVTKIANLGVPVCFDVVPVTLDAAAATAVTLSGGGLVATNTGTTSADQGVRVASANGKTSGKYYIENKITTLLGGGSMSSGVGTTAATYTGLGTNGALGAVCYWVGGAIYATGNSGMGLGGRITGDVLGLAIDLDSRKIWFRVTPAGNWNGLAIGSQNPVGAVGGVTIPAGTITPVLTFGGAAGVANNVQTLNLGASAFTGAVPSGFTSGWPA